MEQQTKRASPLSSTIILAMLVCMLLAACLFAWAVATASVSGTATLPNGATATIDGPFSCSEKPQSTEIEAGGHTFVFSPTSISIDGVPVAPLDATVTDVQIDAGRRSATLRVNGRQIARP